MEWSFEQDILACKYYLSHKDSWRKDIDDLMEEMLKEGFERDKGSVLMRLGNYKAIDQGSGLSHISKQSRKIYELLTNDNERIKEEDFNSFLNFLKLDTNNDFAYYSRVGYDESYSKLIKDFKEESVIKSESESISKVIDKLMKPDRIKRVFNTKDDDKKIRETGKISVSKLCDLSNIQRSNFYDIYKEHYKPDDITLWRMFIGLRCSMEEAIMLGQTVNYQFDKTKTIDQIIVFCIINEVYNTCAIDYFLKEKNQRTIFSKA